MDNTGSGAYRKSNAAQYFQGASMDDNTRRLIKYMETELLALERSLAETKAVDLRPIYREPTKPRAGLLVYADGTEWDPGSGEGLYVFNMAGTWVFLG